MPSEAEVQDKQMMAGCSSFVGTSIFCYLLTVWPFIFGPPLHLTSGFGQACLFALVPASVVGIISARRFGISGATGYVAAAMTTAVFLYLRLDQIFIAAMAKQGPEPEFGRELQWAVPVGYVVASIIASLIVIPRAELS